MPPTCSPAGSPGSSGYDEALLVTPHGRVLEAPTSSIFYVTGGELFTPPLDEHILASITRALVISVTRRRRAQLHARAAQGGRRGVPGLDRARGPCRCRRSTSRSSAGQRPSASGPRSWPPSGSRRSWPPEDPDGDRQPAAVHQGGRRLTDPALAPRRDAGPHRPALRRPAVGDLLRRARAAGAGPAARDRAWLGQLADRTDADRARAGARRCRAGRGARLRRYELDPRRRARRRPGGRSGRPRRGGDAVVRPRDARGAQPRADRPRLVAAAVLQ